MLWEKEKLLVTSNFYFSRSVFKRLLLQTRKNQGLFGKGLSNLPSSYNVLFHFFFFFLHNYELACCLTKRDINCMIGIKNCLKDSNTRHIVPPHLLSVLCSLYELFQQQMLQDGWLVCYLDQSVSCSL